MATIGLCIISPDWKTAEPVITKYAQYFDEVYIQTNRVKDKRANYFKWNNNFADARNALLKKVKTDFWMWIDTDDEIINPQGIRELVDTMDKNGLDVCYLPYAYGHNERGEVDVVHKRERIIRTNFPFKWVAPVHETLLTEATPIPCIAESVAVKHLKNSPEDINISRRRNHKILLREYSKKPVDPRVVFYLGMSYFGLREPHKAIKYFKEHIDKSGSADDIYRSYIQAAECYAMIEQPKMAIELTTQATDVLPQRPEAYIHKADYLVGQGNYVAALEWLDVSESKPEPQNSLQIFDPTIRYKAMFLKAMCLLYLGKVKDAYAAFSKVTEVSPDYKPALDVKNVFEEAFGETLTIEKVNWLAEYLLMIPGAKPAKLLEALPSKIGSDVRLTPTRAKLIKPTVWPSNSLALICGETPDLWGPEKEYIDRGMGGSEEAVLYLSRELNKIGVQVTVFNEREEEYNDDGVMYRPLSLLNAHMNDQFNAVCAWRMPTFFDVTNIDAKLKMVDLHDMVTGHAAISEQAITKTDLFMFKSLYQRSTAPSIPDEKCVIATNGIVPEHFKSSVKRDSLKVVYGSSYDRGLNFLLDIWPRVKKQVPEAELHLYYGWNTFDGFHKHNPAMMKWKWNVVRKIHNTGAIDNGRVSHKELAKAYTSAGVWAYPTEFPEISCITAMKAGASGMMSVTSHHAALAETVLHEYGLNHRHAVEDIYENKEATEKYVGALVWALKHPLPEDLRQRQAKEYIEKFKWSSVAKVWKDAIESRTRQRSIPRSKISTKVS